MKATNYFVKGRSLVVLNKGKRDRMMNGFKCLRRLIAIGLASFCLACPLYMDAKGWEAVKPEKTQGKHVMTDSELEILAGGGIIYVTTGKNVNIKIFTILGSRIADDTLSPGSYQFAVPTHGIYIIKTGDMTFKVAV